MKKDNMVCPKHGRKVELNRVRGYVCLQCHIDAIAYMAKQKEQQLREKRRSD